MRKIAVAVVVSLVALSISGQMLTARHFVGAAGGLGSDDGVGALARFNDPRGIACDASGNLYVTEYGGYSIRKISPAGEVTSITGNHFSGAARSGPLPYSQVGGPWGIAVDAAGAIYVAEERENSIRKILPDGSTYKAAGGLYLYGGGTADGQGFAAQFYSPRGIAIAPDGNIFITDSGNHTIRKMTPGGMVTTFAGQPRTPGYSDGTGTLAHFRTPQAIAVDANGTIYVGDHDNYTIRKITSDGVVTTVAGYPGYGAVVDGTGSGARFYNVTGIAVDWTGALWVTDSGTIRKVTPSGVVTTIAGDGYSSDKDGVGRAAEVNPSGIAIAPTGDFYFVDGGHAVRRISPSYVVTTVAGLPVWALPPTGPVDGTGENASFGNLIGPSAVDSAGNLYIAEPSKIRRITPAGVVTTFAGSTSYGSADGSLTDARFNYVIGLAFDANDTLYVADQGNHTIRKIAGGTVSTLAGSSGLSGTLDGIGSGARFSYINALTVDSSGNLFVTENTHVIRKVTPGGVVTTFAGVAGSAGYVNGTGSAARFNNPTAISIDAADNLYLYDFQNARIRRITPAAVVTTFAGSGSAGSVDGTGTGASVTAVGAISAFRDGGFYFAEWTVVRRMTTDGVITTVAGSRNNGTGVDTGLGSSDGTGTFARFGQFITTSLGVAADANGNVYVIDPTSRNIRVARISSGDAATIDSTTGLVGQPRSLDVIGGSADTFSWTIIRRPLGSSAVLSDATLKNPTFIPDVADRYRFRVVASGPNGVGITEVELTANCDDTVPSPSSTPNPSCLNQPVTLDAGPGMAYRWMTGDTTRTISVVPPNGGGWYSGTVWDENGCAHGFTIVQSAQMDLSTVWVQGNPGCIYSPVTMSCTTNADGGTKSYQWGTRSVSGGPITPLPGQTSSTYSLDYTVFSQPNITYYLTCTVTPSCGTPITGERAFGLLPAINPVVAAGGPTTFCQGGSVTLTAPVGATGYLWSTGATTQSMTVTSEGDYSVRLTNSTCYSYSPVTHVTVLAGPAMPTITVNGPTAFCAGGSVTLTTSANGPWLWSNGSTTQSITVDTTGDYSVTVTGDNGCTTTSAPIHVTANPLPQATIIPSGSTTFCEGGSVALTASAASSYLWSNGATTQSIAISASGNYSVTVTDANGCSTMSTPTAVTVNAPPLEPVITVSGPTTFCEGSSVVLTAPDEAVLYLWSNGATTQSIIVNTGGSYSVTTTNASGCSATSSAIAVTVLPLTTPTISASGPATFCTGGRVTLAASHAAAYLWSNGSTTQSITVDTTGSYSVATTNEFGCTATSSPTVVTVNQPPAIPVVTASGPTTFCAGGSVTLTAPAATSYLWSNGSTLQSITVADSGYYTLTVLDANSCSATSAPTLVTVNPLPPTPTVTAGGPTTFCQGGSVTLTAAAAASYLWSNGSTTQSITVDTTGSYSVATTNEFGCTATSSPTVVTVNQPPAIPVVTASGPTTFCAGGSVTLTAPAATSYLWSNGSTLQSITVADSGYYTLTVLDANSCSATSAPTLVTVNPLPPTPTVTAGGPTTFCQGGSVTLTAAAAARYLWSNGATTQSITVSTPGSYSLTISDANGCSATSTPTVVSVNPPTPVITASGSTDLCPGASVTLTAPAGFAYTWSNGAHTQSITISQAGSYTVMVKDAGGCTAISAPAVVTLKTKTSIKQPSNVSMHVNQTATLTVTASGTNLHYQWYSGKKGDTSTPLGTNASQTVGPYSVKTTYYFWVQVSGDCGVVSSNTINVTVN